MKKIIISFVLILTFYGHGVAQGMLVYDNTSFIALGKSLIESAKQTSELLKTVQFLQDQKERVEKVSQVVRQLRAVQELARNNQRLFNKVRNEVRGILNSPYIRPDEVNRISDSFNAIIEMSLEDLDYIQQILSSDFFKMTDGERTAILKEKEEASREMIASIDQKTRIYQEIISFREMQDKINNRESLQ
jgi:hypothetical protein